MKTLLVAVAVAGITFAARGDDGRIPIYQATTISQSGSYVLTRDLSISSGSAITITGNPSVILDMAGHSIVSTSASTVFNLNFSPGGGFPCGSLSLHNGEVKGNGSGMSTVVGRMCLIDIRIEGVRFNNADVYVEDGSVIAIANRFINSDLQNDANFAGPSALVERNQFQSGGISILGDTAAQVRHNNIQSGSIIVNPSDGFFASQNIVEANSIAGGNIQLAQGAGVDPVTNAVVIGNSVSGSIQVGNCQGCRIAENVTSGCTAGSGMRLTSTLQSVIEGNRIRGCTRGIEFDASSDNNVWRNNVLRGNTSAVLNGGTNNTDAGGNVF